MAKTHDDDDDDDGINIVRNCVTLMHITVNHPFEQLFTLYPFQSNTLRLMEKWSTYARQKKYEKRINERKVKWKKQ